MKKILVVVMVGLLTACEKSREIDNTTIQCIGLDDDPLPGVKYEVSTRNAIFDVIFVESAIVPIWSLLTDIKCPVRK